MPSGRTGYPECAAGGKRLLQHGMPRMQEKIAGRGVPQVYGGDAIRGQSMHRRARRSAGGEVPRMPESFKPGSAASRPPRMPHMPGKASSRLFIVRQCWNPSAGNICHVPYQSGKKTGSFHISRKIRPHRIKGWKIRYGIRQQRIHLRVASIKRSCFFVSEIIPKPFPLRRVMSLWAGDSVVAVGTAQRPVGDVPSGGEQRGRPSERRGTSAKAI